MIATATPFTLLRLIPAIEGGAVDRLESARRHLGSVGRESGSLALDMVRKPKARGPEGTGGTGAVGDVRSAASSISMISGNKNDAFHPSDRSGAGDGTGPREADQRGVDRAGTGRRDTERVGTEGAGTVDVPSLPGGGGGPDGGG